MATKKTTTKAKTKGPILVTGGAGHLGANLVHRLVDDGEDVRVLLRPSDDNSAVEGLDVDRVWGDFRDPAVARQAVEGCERVFHVGAKVSTIDGTHEHKREIYDCNVLGTRNILGAALDAGVKRVVVTGSFSAVGHHLDDPSKPADESVPFYPFERAMPYERSKVLVELEAHKAIAEGLDVVLATSCAIVGSHDYLPSRMGRTLCDYANGKLRAYVAGGFEFVAARDIVQGHLLAMEKGRTGHKYILSTQFLTLDDMLDVFEEATGVPKPKLKLPAPVMGAFSEVASFVLSRAWPSFPQRLTPGAIRLLQLRRHADITKAKEELGYEPTSIPDAVREQYAFFWDRGAITNPHARRPERPAAAREATRARSAA